MERGVLRPALALAAVAVVMTLVVGALLMLRASGGTSPGARGSTPTPGPIASSPPPTRSPSTSPSASAAPTSPPAPTPPSATAPPPAAATLLGAGDIASCGLDGDSQTAALVERIDGAVFTAGDNAYESGTAREFRDCYAPTWGRFKDRTIPVPGNHDYETPGAAGYVDYFGAAARPHGTTWYSREIGAWHVIVLDSDCDAIGGCDTGSEQVAWLRDDLAGTEARCTLAIWHHPRFTSGQHRNDSRFDAFWRTLFEANADVVVNGHDHDYERFAPQDPDSQPDPERGIREFVVGTGGASLRAFGTVVANSELRDSKTHGVLMLTLEPDAYAWQFIPVAGETFTDSGSGVCH